MVRISKKRCKGCSHRVTVIRIHLETGEVDIEKDYCDSEETKCAGCSADYPNLTKAEIMKKFKDKRLWRF